jgi:hypothetical protein
MLDAYIIEVVGVAAGACAAIMCVVFVISLALCEKNGNNEKVRK